MPHAIVLLLLLALSWPAPVSAQQSCDTLIAGGRIADGSGGKPHLADLAIRNGRIVALGELGGYQADRTIDARGLVVAPGFIDVHAHADNAAHLPEARNFLLMGVTTIVSGNCGYSNEDLHGAFAAITEVGCSLNFASLIGHGTVRSAVLGNEQRAPTAGESEQMQALVREAMRAGALGLSTGLIYVPGTFADTDEIIALAKVVAEAGGVYASHIRNENDHVVEAVEEALEIGRKAGIKVHISHLKASGKNNWGKSREVVEAMRSARRAGQPVTGDQYAYDAANTSLDVLFPSEDLAEGGRAFARRIRDDAVFRRRMHEALLAKMDHVGFGDLSYCRIASAPDNAELSGMTIPEAAALRMPEHDRNAQAELTLDLVVAADGRRINMIYHTMSDADVETFMVEPWVAVASDAGIFAEDQDGKPHPRGAGNTARVLAHFVRGQRTLSLGAAIRKMTSLPAEVFGLTDRGHLRVGAWADVTIFDADQIQDLATFDEPLLAPTGISWVLVNGIPVVENGVHTGRRPGVVIRHRSTH